MTVRTLTAQECRSDTQRRGWAAEVVRALRGGLSRVVFGDMLDISETRVRGLEIIDEPTDKTKSPRLALDKVPALTADQRVLLASLILPATHAVVELPPAAESFDDWKLAADTTERATGAAVAFTRAIADGGITAKESGEGRPLNRAAIAALLAVDARYESAERNRGIGLRVAGGKR